MSTEERNKGFYRQFHLQEDYNDSISDDILYPNESPEARKARKAREAHEAREASINNKPLKPRPNNNGIGKG